MGTQSPPTGDASQWNVLLERMIALKKDLRTAKQELQEVRKSSPPEKSDAAQASALLSLAEKAKQVKGLEKGAWEKDLPKLTKLVKGVRFEPKNEREFEEVLYEWETKARSSGMGEAVLKQLVLHLGLEKVLHVSEQIDIPQMSWSGLKDALTVKLFSYSRYRQELETKTILVDQSKPVNKALLLLSKQRVRYACLCNKRSKPNSMSDDRLKEAFLAKLPAHRVTACVATKDYNRFTFDDFW